LKTQDIRAFTTQKTPPPNPQIGKILYTVSGTDLYYRKIAKCGCTTVLNLLHFFNTGLSHIDPLLVHQNQSGQLHADHATLQGITNSNHAFVVIRDPIQRFLSLYFDKIYPSNPYNQSHLSSFFVRRGIIEPNVGTNIERHRENCIASAHWIKRNLAHQTVRPTNAHWRPQHYRLNQISRYNFHVLQLEDLHFQLSEVLKSCLPNIQSILRQTKPQNISPKPVDCKKIINKTLTAVILDIYKQDSLIYDEVQTYWDHYKAAQTCLKNPKNKTSTAG